MTDQGEPPQTGEQLREASCGAAASRLRRARRLAVIAVAPAIGSFFFSGQVFLFSPMVGLFLAFLALTCFLPVPRTQADPPPVVSKAGKREWWNSFLFCLLVLFGQGCLMQMTLGRARAASKATVTQANLMGIGMALKLYHEDEGEHAPCLGDLKAANHTVGKQLLSLDDPAIWSWEDTDPPYSSFAYNPGVGPWRADPEIVFAFEREPWTATEMRLFPKHGRWVLFGDGLVRWLIEGEFREALERDRARRSDLNWPEWSMAAESRRR